MKYILLAFISLFLIAFASAQTLEECHASYFFIIDHINNDNEFTYTDLEFEYFLQNNNLTRGNATSLLNDYEMVCKDITNLRLPEIILEEKDLNKLRGTKCSLALNKGFFDYKIPMPDVNIGEIKCYKIEALLWFFDIEENLSGNFLLTGLRTWLLVLVILIVLYFPTKRFIKNNSFINKELHKTLAKNEGLKI